MFPISDEKDPNAHGPAIITLLIILANIAVFIFLQHTGHNDAFTYAYSMVPHEVLSGHDVAQTVRLIDPVTGSSGGSINLQPTPIPIWETIFTSMFMHGGFMHLFGNMLFLWIFGDNLEHAMGRFKFLCFYLICGTAAAACQIGATVFSGANDLIPMLGASGAISGILGGYMVLFPTRRVNVLLWFFITAVPAWVCLGLWFVFQLISGMGILGSATQVGGVAYAAHIGGFISGLMLVRAFANRGEAISNLRRYQHHRDSARF